MNNRLLKTLAAVVLVGCASEATDPLATPNLSVAIAPNGGACLPADVVVSNWEDLQTALHAGPQVTAIAGTIEVPANVVENVAGVTLTCSAPGAGLVLNGSLTLSGGPITLEGLTVLGGPGLFMISAWPETPIRIARNHIVASAAGWRMLLDHADGAEILENTFAAPFGVGSAGLWVANARAPRVRGNDFTAVGYAIAHLVLHQSTDVDVAGNHLWSSQAPLFSAIKKLGAEPTHVAEQLDAKGQKLDLGGVLSPAMLLMHELGHAYQRLAEPEGFKEGVAKGKKGVREIENLNVNAIENTVALELRAAGKPEGVRWRYQDIQGVGWFQDKQDAYQTVPGPFPGWASKHA